MRVPTKLLHKFRTQSCHSLSTRFAADCGIMRDERVGVALWWPNKSKSDLCVSAKSVLSHTHTFLHNFSQQCVLRDLRAFRYAASLLPHTFGEILCARRVNVATITL